ncbi:MAG: flagellar protein FlaG [Lachnospiraceae bacterium]
MAIESVNSAMVYQAQNQIPRTTQSERQHTDSENMDGTLAGVTLPEENAISAVKQGSNADHKDNGQNTGTKEQQELNQDQMKKAVDKLNKNLNNSEAIFGIHEGTHRVTIKIIDKTTKETIKELPPEKTLDMIAKAWELAGLLVDERR